MYFLKFLLWFLWPAFFFIFYISLKIFFDKKRRGFVLNHPVERMGKRGSFMAGLEDGFGSGLVMGIIVGIIIGMVL